MLKIFTFLKDMDDVDKSRIVKISGIVVALFAAFTLLSCVSYLFTWKVDQSLLETSITDASLNVENLAGKVGFRWSNFVVRQCFGLGSFALIVILFAVSVRLLLGRWHYSMLKTIVVTLSGALLASLALAFLSELLGMTNAFGGGLGGECGETLVQIFSNLFGSIITGFLIVALILLWLFFVSRRFVQWVATLTKRKADEPEDSEGVEDGDESDLDPSSSTASGSTASGSTASGSAASGSTASGSTASASAPIEDDGPFPIASGYGSSSSSVSSGASGSTANASAGSSANSSAGSSATSNGHVVAGVDDPFSPKPLVEGPIQTRPSHAPSAQTAAGSTATPTQTAKPADSEGTLEIIKDDGLTTKVKAELPRINVRDELPDYKFPTLELLDEHECVTTEVSEEEIVRNNNKIRSTLENYKIRVLDVKAIVGPTVTLYKVYPATGVRISEIKRLQDDIGIYLHARGVRVVTLTDCVGIEVANDKPATVPVRAVLNDDAFRNSKAELPIAIGYTIQQKVKVFDLADAPHLLVAGATKQGKSVGLNTMIASLLYSKHPSELKLVFIDPKMVEFSSYASLLHHYLAVLPYNDEREEADNAIVKKADKADKTLKSLCIEMDQRYELLSKALVPNIKTYNNKYKDRHLLPTEGHRFLPYIVTIIDEYADLTMSVGGSGEAKNIARSITTSIIRLAQKGRAAGIHIVLATQRPSVDVVTGLIKTNFPTRIAFRVFSRTDSATILDSPGAEKLIGRGDMLYYAGVETERVQCAFLDNDEINRVNAFIGAQLGYKKSYSTPYYLPDVEEASEDGVPGMIDMKNLDERFEEAARMVVANQRGSTSDLQRRLGMGYAKAGRVMDQLQAAGVVGPQEGSKPREVLINSLDDLEKTLEAYRNQ